MTSFFAAATLFLTGTGKRHTWTPPLPSPSPAPDNRWLNSDPGSRNCLNLRHDTLLDADLPGCSTACNGDAVSSPCYVLTSDGSPQSTNSSPSPADMDAATSPTPTTILSIDGATCFSPDCDHSYCSPPQLLYSPASCSSIALHTPLPTTGPFSSIQPNSPDRLLLSPTGFAPSNDKPISLLPASAAATKSTLAERRGLKGLALQSAPAFSPIIELSSDTSTPTLTLTPTSALTPRSRLLSPRTPDSASSFAQRLVGLMRPATPNTANPDSPAEREYFEDPFGRAAPPFFDDAYFFGAAPDRPHPDLFDLSVYSTPPAGAPRSSKTWPAAKRMKTRLWIDAVDLLEPFPGSDAHPLPGCATRAGPSVHSTRARLDRDRPAAPRANAAPSAAAPPPVLTLALSHLPAAASPNLRPLLLPQKFARREIADAQSSSILQHATPKLRPLILPQELARRATHPQRRARPRPLTFPSTLALTHRRALSMGTPFLPSSPRMSIASTSTGASEAEIEDIISGESSGDMGRRGEDRRQSQQLDEIICLLDKSGVLEGLCEAGDEQETADSEVTSPSPSCDSDDNESAGVATPPSLVSRPGSSSSFSFISQSYASDTEDVAEKSRNLEDILELLNSPDGGITCRTFVEAPAMEGESEDLICAYAM
ncbi:uncharacterized protein TRAVEDRAFT_72586 [Trametes versicolor FP-101664 SS1]|uniref:uncharacterized protein n=1 Tax=Trametes versicolor (strain FP-101664) TaxID=717944 RepID=UPI000462402B|nr:uncharacterized protein TRAVEDRAFT_72586 [Trametes versicolor FP-101664 SS1]EIW57500.1 hypothetical protein TRAVEDRAFT_72586 [Trametes versicolor FP-101664 SS1]